jgi:hypothetical protein
MAQSKTTKFTKELEGLRRKLGDAKGRERKIRSEQAVALEAVRAADRALEDHYAQEGADPEPSGLLGERAVALERADQPWEARVAGAKRQEAAAESELSRYVTDHLGDLMAEAEPEAKKAAEAVGEKMAELTEAIEGWYAVEQRVVSILGPVPGMTGRDLPRPPFEGLRSELRRLHGEEIPAPLPRSLYGGDDEDPTIRSEPVGGSIAGTVGPAD